MADSQVVIPATGTGTATPAVSTRTNASGEHVQVVVVGIDGSDSIVGTDVANGLDVDVTRVQGTVTTDVSDRTLRDLGKVDLVEQPGAPNVASGQITIGTTATQIVPTRTTRRSLAIAIHAGVDLYVGGSGVLTTTGFKVKGVDGAVLEMWTSGAVFGVVATGTLVVSFLEVYD